MKKVLFFIVLLITSLKLYASPQAPELLIINNDTIPIYQIPFDGLDKNIMDSFYSNLEKGGTVYSSFSLWRGFRGIWNIIDGELYLVGLHGVENADVVFKETFGVNYSGIKCWRIGFPLI